MLQPAKTEPPTRPSIDTTCPTGDSPHQTSRDDDDGRFWCSWDAQYYLCRLIHHSFNFIWLRRILSDTWRSVFIYYEENADPSSVDPLGDEHPILADVVVPPPTPATGWSASYAPASPRTRTIRA